MSKFYTQKGYEMQNSTELTSSMEDYLEMICRLSLEKGYVRIGELSAELNVRPSSASKMADNLKKFGLIVFEKYSCIQPTEKGVKIGEYLLYRHDILNKFLCFVNHSEDELEEVEKIEHFLRKETIINIDKMLAGLDHTIIKDSE